MKLFHLSLDLNIIKEFVPRIPSENVMVENEDYVTPRICLGKTIRGCLTAVPWGGNTFEELFFDNMVSQLIRVYEFDSDDIVKGNLISSEDLYQSDKVRDSEISGEVWAINQSLKPTNTYVIQITDYEEGCVDDIKYDDMKNFNEEEDDMEDIINGCFTTVESIRYNILPEMNYCDRFLFNFTVKAEEGYSEDDIYDKVDVFVSEHWGDYNIEIKEVDEIGTYNIELLVDLSDKPTTEENFINLFYTDIGINTCMEKVA